LKKGGGFAKPGSEWPGSISDKKDPLQRNPKTSRPREEIAYELPVLGREGVSAPKLKKKKGFKKTEGNSSNGEKRGSPVVEGEKGIGYQEKKSQRPL